MPEDICAVFDLENFPGKRALEKRPINNLEWALICSGVPADQVYDTLETEEGVQKALDKLDTIKDQTVWWSAGAETPQLLADGEVVIGSTYNGRLFSVIEEQDQPVAMLWDYEVLDIDGFVVPADLPEDRLNRVKHFLRFTTDTQRLADQTKYISYGPARASSQPLVSTHAELGIDMAPHMPTSPENAETGFLFNYEWWADQPRRARRALPVLADAVGRTTMRRGRMAPPCQPAACVKSRSSAEWLGVGFLLRPR